MDIGRVEDYLEGTDNAYDLVRMQHESMKAASDTTETKSAEVYVARSPEELLKTHTFRERVGQKELAFKDDSVLVSEKLARLLGVGTGDTITLFEMDDIGEADGSGMRLEVTGVYENYVGYPVFVGLKAWEDAGQKKPRFSTIEAKLRDGSKEAEAEVSDHLRDFDEVSTVRFTTDNIENVYKSIRVVDLVVWVLVFAAGILALIVIYNLTNINIGERIREIASLKVLGFTKREVYTYIFREVRLLSVIGDALGLFLGTAMARFVIVTAEADYTMFGRTIYPLSYVVAFVVTLIFAQLILVLMRKKLDKVDMVESLKSVD
jgi:putative ABC transport system permease protein